MTNVWWHLAVLWRLLAAVLRSEGLTLCTSVELIHHECVAICRAQQEQSGWCQTYYTGFSLLCLFPGTCKTHQRDRLWDSDNVWGAQRWGHQLSLAGPRHPRMLWQETGVPADRLGQVVSTLVQPLADCIVLHQPECPRLTTCKQLASAATWTISTEWLNKTTYQHCKTSCESECPRQA